MYQVNIKHLGKGKTLDIKVFKKFKVGGVQAAGFYIAQI